MKQIQDAIFAMGGRQKGEGTLLLCMAIEEARQYQPMIPQMKEIWASLRKRTGKRSEGAVGKALERAVYDLWQNGDRKVMATYQRGWLYDRPTPREFIPVMACRFWDGVERTHGESD